MDYGRVGAAGAVKVGDKALQIYNKFSKAAKANKVATARNPELRTSNGKRARRDE
jgi:hypothetical protein